MTAPAGLGAGFRGWAVSAPALTVLIWGGGAVFIWGVRGLDCLNPGSVTVLPWGVRGLDNLKLERVTVLIWGVRLS